MSVPVSSNSVSEDGYGSRPASTDGTAMSSGMPVSTSGRITGEHMNGSFSRGSTPGISGIVCCFVFLRKCIFNFFDC